MIPVIIERQLLLHRCQYNGLYETYNHCKHQTITNNHIRPIRWISASTCNSRRVIETPIQSRYLRPKFFTPERVEIFVKNLKEKERQELYLELQKYPPHSNGSNADNKDNTVSKNQLKLLFLFNCAPFIGFGFLDNAIMILAGEYIDVTIGVTLGITTMAAAALGNLVSDLFGIGLAGYVEILCSKVGLPVPDLTSQQLDLTTSRVAANFGKAVGIVIGCILGMFPLLFMKNKDEVIDDAGT